MEFEIKLTEADIAILDEALVNLEYIKVAELITKINQQINEQVDKEESM